MSQIPYTVRKVTILTVVFCFCLFVCGVEALASLNGISDISKLDCLSPGQWECRSGRCSEPGLRFSLNSGSGWEQSRRPLVSLLLSGHCWGIRLTCRHCCCFQEADQVAPSTGWGGRAPGQGSAR